MTVPDQTDVQQDCGCGCGGDKAQPASTSVSKGEGRSIARLPARSVPRSTSLMIRSSGIERRTRRMLSDQHADP